MLVNAKSQGVLLGSKKRQELMPEWPKMAAFIAAAADFVPRQLRQTLQEGLLNYRSQPVWMIRCAEIRFDHA